MSNIISLDTNANHEVYFPVKETPVIGYDANGKAIESSRFKSVMNTHTGEVLGVNERRYKLVRHSEVFPVFEQALRQNMNTNGMKVDTSVRNGGALVIRDYLLPEHKVQVRGEDIAYKLRTANSYDGSFKFGVIAGGWREACWNGQVMGQADLFVRRKHTRNMAVEEYVDKFRIAADKFHEEGERWKRWVDTAITPHQVTQVIQKLPGINDKTEQVLQDTYSKYHREMGGNVYALFNTLTDWSTHTPAQSNQRADLLTINRREERVAKVLPLLDKIAA